MKTCKHKVCSSGIKFYGGSWTETGFQDAEEQYKISNIYRLACSWMF